MALKILSYTLSKFYLKVGEIDVCLFAVNCDVDAVTLEQLRNTLLPKHVLGVQDVSDSKGRGQK